MTTYLWTLEELYKNAYGENLGSMDKGTYDEYQKKVNEVAKKAGIAKPKMAIDLKFKKGAHDFLSEQPYPINKDEWDVFLKDAKTMCEYIPRVFVVDGSKFSLPI